MTSAAEHQQQLDEQREREERYFTPEYRRFFDACRAYLRSDLKGDKEYKDIVRARRSIDR